MTKQIHGLITKPTDKATPPYPSTTLSLSFNQTNLIRMKRGTFNKENDDSRYIPNQRQGPIYINMWALLIYTRVRQKKNYIKDSVLGGLDGVTVLKAIIVAELFFFLPQYIGVGGWKIEANIELIFRVELQVHLETPAFQPL